jgi:hypothetical protein
MANPGFGSNNRVTPAGTNSPTQQRNVDMLRSEQNARKAQIKPQGRSLAQQNPNGPKLNLDGTPGIPGVKKPMHSAVGANKRQFGSVGGAMKNTLSRVRTASRLKGLLRRGR